MERKKRMVLAHLFGILGALCLFYYIVMILYAGINTSFASFWLIAGLAGLFIDLGIHMAVKKDIQVPPALRGLVLGGCLLIGLLFLLVEGVIIYYGQQKPSDGADYLIVLGAQVKGTRVSKSLQKRLDKALEYLEENDQTKVIVSGGQGSGEDISEAQAMSSYLLERGIAAWRIILEDQSTNTDENIRFSKARMEPGENHTVIVTNSFHVFRAVQIAKKQELGKIEGLGASSDKVQLISYYVREFFAVIKDKLVGNMN